MCGVFTFHLYTDTALSAVQRLVRGTGARPSLEVENLERQLPRRPLDLAWNVHAGAEAFRTKVSETGRGDFLRRDSVPDADDLVPHCAAAVDEARAAARAARRVGCLDKGHCAPPIGPRRQVCALD